MILISACLAGENVRYDGGNKGNITLKNLVDKGFARTICPEILAGLSIPRAAAEIVDGDGYDVLHQKAKIIDLYGNDVTEDYVRGAKIALNICKELNCSTLILKSDSPTCGSNTIYSGAFDGTKKSGDGVFTALLKVNGIEVYDETYDELT